MYAVFYSNKRLKQLGLHYSYEQARSAARKYIRKNKESGYDPIWDGTNPAITYFGLAVKRV